MLQVIAFYLFSTVMIASALLVIAARNPVHSVLFLILAFFNAAALFVALIGPSWTLTRASAAELLPASGLSGVWITAILPVSLALMALEVLRALWQDGVAPWRERTTPRLPGQPRVIVCAGVVLMPQPLSASTFELSVHWRLSLE